MTEGQIGDAKSRGNAAFKKGDYLSAIYLYGVVSFQTNKCIVYLFEAKKKKKKKKGLHDIFFFKKKKQLHVT